MELKLIIPVVQHDRFKDQSEGWYMESVEIIEFRAE